MTGGTRFVLPQATREAALSIPWLAPHFMDADGRLKSKPPPRIALPYVEKTRWQPWKAKTQWEVSCQHAWSRGWRDS